MCVCVCVCVSTCVCLREKVKSKLYDIKIFGVSVKVAVKIETIGLSKHFGPHVQKEYCLSGVYTMDVSIMKTSSQA